LDPALEIRARNLIHFAPTMGEKDGEI
jgi:hypothetical protein